MRVLIAGCGYVGLPLGAALAKLGHEVFGLRRSTLANVELRAADIAPLHADITCPETLARLPKDFDWVVNCTASGGGTAEDYRRVYLGGTRNLLAWLAPAPPQKFVYTSSSNVHGQNDGSWVTETSPAEPLAETGRVLLETEQVLLGAWWQKHFPAVILRVAGIYGPGRGFYFRSLVRGEARIEGDGDRFVNMIHRDDVAGAIRAALERGRPGAIYNVCDDEPVALRELYRWLAEKLHLPMPPSVPADFSASRQRGVTNKRISNRRLRSELGWNPQFPTFRQGHALAIARLAGDQGDAPS
jgi:nucleoside-diphosphate-sugar epimerase